MIGALVHGQQQGDDGEPLVEWVCDAVLRSLVEVLRLVATAATSRDKRNAFYGAIAAFWEERGNGESKLGYGGARS